MIEKKPTPLLQRIFELRKSKKISLKELGKALGGVQTATASQIENGDTPLKAEYLPAVAKLLGVPIWELFSDYDPKEIGPLSEEEKAIVLNLRRFSDENDRRAMKEVFKHLTKTVS